jgi:hypothetical protein
MKKTVQLLAFLVTASMVFTSASYKGLQSYYVNSSPYLPAPPDIEACITEINFVVESSFGTAYWALYDISRGQFVTSTDIFPHMIYDYINIWGYYNFICRQINLVLE